MPYKRESSIPPLSTAAELLAFLQVEGHLEGVEMPHWMPGTSVAELLDALSYLGDAQWLDGRWPGKGQQESADQWVMDFLTGKDAPAHGDVASAEEDENENEDEDEEASLSEEELSSALDGFAEDMTEAERARFAKRRSDPAFASLAGAHFMSLSAAVGRCGFLDDEEFASERFDFLIPERAADPDLAAMTRFYLLEGAEAMAGNFPPDAARTLLARTKALAKRASALAKPANSTRRPVKKAARKSVGAAKPQASKNKKR